MKQYGERRGKWVKKGLRTNRERRAENREKGVGVGWEDIETVRQLFKYFDTLM